MFQNRIKNLQNNLDSNKIDALVVSGAMNIAYLTGYSNFSMIERGAYLFATESSVSLFTDGRYIEAVQTILPKGTRVFLHTELFRRIRNSKTKKIGIEHNFTVAELKRFKKETKLNFILTEQIIEQLRSLKDLDEIKKIRAACKLTDRTFGIVRRLIKIGVTEKELAWKTEKFIKERGGELAFEPIVAFGPNSAIPHHKASNKKLTNKDQFVLLDFGAKINGYCSDMTRTLLTKNAKSKAHEIYETVLTAQQKAIEYINSSDGGRLSVRSHDSSEVAKIANDYIVSKGFDQIPHGLGHGIGLEVHEKPRLSPKSKNKLAWNNVFTIEPGIYIPGFGGIRIEDDFLLGEKLRLLTQSPKNP